MNTQDSRSAAGRETAPEGKDPDGPRPGGAAPEGKDAGEGGGGDPGEQRATEARYDTLGGMMKEDAFDINTTRCGPYGVFALPFALGWTGQPHDEKAVKLVLGVRDMDVNLTNATGATALLAQCSLGRSRNVKLLVADPRVYVNLADENGFTPLNAAANEGRARCVEILLSDNRVDVCLGPTSGPYAFNTPLISACVQLMNSMDRVGAPAGSDPASILVIMLKSRRIPHPNLKESIVWLHSKCMPTRRMIDNAEAGGEPLTPQQKTARLVVPILVAQASGEFRWCAHCHKLTPDVNLNRCGGCKQVGYCEPDPASDALRGTKPCHVAHWKAHKKDCKRFQAEAKEAAEAEAAAAEAGGAGGGGGKKKKKKGKKAKKKSE